MKKLYADLRSEYLHDRLDEGDVLENPFSQFEKWMNEAILANILHPTSMILATAGKDGQPSCRVVLLKEIDENGLMFFTNYLSKKGQQLTENPRAAVTFFWNELERQIRIEGTVEKVEREISETYFNSRPFESRLSAAVSPQSQIVKNREELENAQEILKNQIQDQIVPRPENWGGFLLKPHHFEFWQGRENRLHDRIIYTPVGEKWIIQRLAP